MHIIRHYRPDVVRIIMTKELVEMDRRDQRFLKMQEFIEDKWGGYHFWLERVESDVEDPSDLDTVAELLMKSASELQKEYPDAEFLLNMSSGTPQMKMVFSMIALAPEFHARGIQVKIPGRSSGKTERTNTKDYDVELELLCNEDEKEDAPNRCEEPRLFYLRKEKEIESIRALLEKYDYAAVRELARSLPPELIPIVEHLKRRKNLDAQGAREMAREAARKNSKLPPLYPRNDVCRSQKQDYEEVSEFMLLLRSLQKSGNYTEFVLRMNPFVIRLQLEYLKKLRHYDISRICYVNRTGTRIKWDPEKFSNNDPGLYSNESSHYGSLEYKDVSLSKLNEVLSEAILLDTRLESENNRRTLNLFIACEKLNKDGRNLAAHSLRSITDEEIRKICGMDSRKLRLEFEHAMTVIYNGSNPKLFEIYDDCNEYIVSRMRR